MKTTSMLTCTKTKRLVSLLMCACTLAIASLEVQAGDWRYSLRPGDTIWSICAEYTAYDKCWKELPAYNDVAEPTKMSTGFVLKIPNEWLKRSQIAAQVVYVSGAASFISPSKPQQALVQGQQLRIGDGVAVNQGSVTLQFTDGASIVMSANSALTIDSVAALKQSRSQAIDVSLSRGDIKVTVPKRSPKPQFRVTTPAAVAAVRGTQFRVSSSVPESEGDAVETRSEVLEGVVEVSSIGEGSAISAGYGIKALQGQTLSDPTQLLTAPVWNLECTDPGYVEWQGSPDTAEFQLVLMEDDTSVDRIISTVALTGSNYTFKDLEEQCYQVKVNSVDQQGFNGLESQRQLCYELVLAQPLLSEARLKRKQFSTAWDTVAFADSYLIEVSKDEDFSQVLYTEVVSAENVNLQLQDSHSSVYVRAKSQSDSGAQSEYSEAVYVEQKSSGNILIGIAAAVLVFVAL